MNGLETQYLLVFLLIVTIVVVACVRVGALWLRLALIDLLVISLIRRIDQIGAYFSIDLVNQNVTDFTSFLVIAIILFAFLAAYIRKPFLLRAERELQEMLLQKHQPKIEQLESLRAESERWSSWSS